jgi:hypothetical protein
MAKRTMRRAKKTARRVKSKMSKKAMRRSSKKTRKSTKKKKKGKKKANAWNKHVMVVYKSMQKTNSSVKLGEAMKEAKKTYKKSNTV